MNGLSPCGDRRGQNHCVGSELDEKGEGGV